MMQRFWRALGVALGKYWIAVYAAVLIITVGLGTQLSDLEFATGQDSYLEPDSRAAIDNVEYQDAFGGETLILLFQADEGSDVRSLFTEANQAELARLEAELRDIDSTYSVVAPLTTLGYTETLVNEVGTGALASALENDPDPASQELRQADLDMSLARLSAIPAEERNFDSPEWIQFLLFGNVGYSFDDEGNPVAPPVEEQVIRPSLKSTYPQNDVAVGGILLEPNADLDTLAAGTDGVVDIMETADLDGFSVITTGSPVFLGEINDYLQGGMLALGASAMVVMAIVLTFMFKVRWRLLPLVAVLFGVIWAFSLVGIIGLDLSLVTISGLPILIGVGIDFAIQIHNRIEEEVVMAREPHPIATTLAALVPPLSVATISAILAFTAMQVSRVPMIRDFGVLLMIGVGVLLFTGVVITASTLGIREYKGRTAVREESRVERVVVKLGSLSPKTAVPLIIGSVLLFVAGIALEGSFEIQSDPIQWVNQDSQVVEDLNTLEDETGFSSTLGILIEANDVLDEDLDNAIHEFNLFAADLPNIATTSSMVNTVAKITEIPGTNPVPPTDADVRKAAELLPPDLQRVLIAPDRTATQINLRLSGSLDERAELVEVLEADLEARIAAIEVPADSPLRVDLADDQPPIRAVPAGLAIVGVSLLENLSANRALLTYLGLAIVGLWLTVRYRSLTRTGLSLLPVGLAVGASSSLIAVLGVSLSPLTTVSGPLVVATCTEFSILIVARYIEERERGLTPQEASNQAAARTGRAFFTSAATTIGGFAVLIGSALPLLRDFGIIVTVNVAVALLAALVVMPPVLVWADRKNLLAGQIRLNEEEAAANPEPAGAHTKHLVGAVIGAVVFAGAIIGMLSSAETSTASAEDFAYVEVDPPTTTTTEAATGGAVDPSTFGTEAPTGGTVAPLLFEKLVAQGADPQATNCAIETLFERTDETSLLTGGLAQAITEQDLENPTLQQVVQAGLDCGISQDTIDATIAAGL